MFSLFCPILRHASLDSRHPAPVSTSRNLRPSFLLSAFLQISQPITHNLSLPADICQTFAHENPPGSSLLAYILPVTMLCCTDYTNVRGIARSIKSRVWQRRQVSKAEVVSPRWLAFRVVRRRHPASSTACRLLPVSVCRVASCQCPVSSSQCSHLSRAEC